jgi:ABC-type branched-subunit amino acid transport system substrate-binding protein
MPNTGLWFRQRARALREQPRRVQVLTVGGAAALLLVVVIIGVSLVSSDSSPAARVNSNRGGLGTDGVDDGGSSTTLALAAGGTTVTGRATTKSGHGIVQPGAAGGPGGGAITRSLNLNCAPKCETGVTSDKVKVAFPWFDITETCNLTGTCAQIESGEKAVRKFVDIVNKNGGIAGRQIDPLIVKFNPLNETEMTELCRRWAEDDKVFAVVDSEAWHSRHQLCITEQHKMPLVTSFTLVEEWAKKRGNPYLWWTGPSTDDIIDNWVSWAKQKGVIGAPGQVIGVAFSDRAEDVIAAKLMKAALARVGITDALFETIPYDNAEAQAALPLAINRMKSYKGTGVTRLFAALPFTTFAFWLNQAEQQQFFPRYLLSDLAQGLVTAEALLGSQFPNSLNKAIGPTYTHLGEGPPPKSPYDAAEKECNVMWRQGDPDAVDLFHAGVAMRWCTNIGVFVEAARRATVNSGGSLTRLNFAAAMATISRMPTGMTPTLSWAAGDYAGGEVAKVVEVRTKEPDNKKCVDGSSDTDGICHVEVEPFAPLRRFH